MPTRMMIESPQCPRCGGTLVTDGVKTWCSYVGSERGRVPERPCVCGLDGLVVAPKAVRDDFDQRLAGSRRPADLDAARQQLAQDRAALAAADLLAYDPAAPVGFITAGALTTLDTPSMEQIAQAMEQFQAETRRIDDGFAVALRDMIGQSGLPIHDWATALRVEATELEGVLDGTTRPIPARFYDEARRVFPSGAAN